MPDVFDHIDTMAQRYAAAIIEAYPEGPYSLLGWSSGGLIAMAIASELEKQGKDVDFVSLLDSRPLSTWLDEITEEKLLYAAIQVVVTAMCKGNLPPDFAADLGHYLQDNRLTEIFSEAQSDMLLLYLAELTGRSSNIHELDTIKQQVEITKRHLALLSRYVPEKINAPLHIVWAKESHIEPVILSYYDGENVSSSIAVVEGNHYGMLNAPHVSMLAQSIQLFSTKDTARIPA